ncbi:MAG: 50S ribosomal protein L18 [Patescibacteria group bacterium]|nr:50S ribosomal protein L18 [Patescibacteria group bacterium]MDE2116685.1 50S ribosomal protein L18 [Patescibacteria group bacterium]
MKKNIKKQKRTRRHVMIRVRVSGTAKTPRLAVFRSNRYMYAQLIDDESGKTLASASSLAAKAGKAKKGGKKLDVARGVGKAIAEKAVGLKIKSVVFDRGGFGYKGRVRALADGAREGGLKF